MKLLVFAHTPPPHHGQSYMVQLMLEGFGGDWREKGSARHTAHQIECYHVNARVSKKLQDIGDLRFSKFFLLMWYCLQAIWCHYRYGVDCLYYVPAPGKKSALYRDWLVMFICRPFFKRLILHWHAAGLAKWLETSTQIRTRSITYRALKDIDLNIVLSNYNRHDAEKFLPRAIKVVGNGILDPCPDFERDVLPRRVIRRQMRARLMAGEQPSAADLVAAGNPRVVNVLYIAHCMREKGLLDAITAVRLANRKLAAEQSPLSLHLKIAGNFVDDGVKEEFDRILSEPDAAGSIHYEGFVSGDTKQRVFREADLFCFPTYYQNENQPVNLIEAMAFGLPAVTTRWRSLPEMYPADYPGLVDICSPQQAADALLKVLSGENEELFRHRFLEHYAFESHLAGLAAAFHSVEQKTGAACSGA